jgi:glucan 1,3-beta-glucosidase
VGATRQLVDAGDVDARLAGRAGQFEFEAILARRFGTAEKDRLLELYRAQYIRERDFPIIRSFGFNTVRLPFNYRCCWMTTVPENSNPMPSIWLDTAVALARRHGLYVILDMHGTPGGQSGDHTTGRRDQNRLWTSEEDQQRPPGCGRGLPSITRIARPSPPTI